MKKRLNKTMALALSAALSVTSLSGFLPGGIVQAETKANTITQLYVAVNGSDSNPGTRENPFATVERARQEVANVNDDMKGDIIVNIGPGEYYMDSTVRFSEEDSATNGYQIIYKSGEGMGSARLNGGVLVNNWNTTTQADVAMGLEEALVGKVFKTQLDPEKFDFNALYVNDKKAIMARTKNYKEDPRYPAQRGEYLFSAGGDMRSLVWKEGDLDNKSIDGMSAAQQRGEEEIAQLFVWDGGDWDWFTNTIPIHYIKPEERRLGADEVPGRDEMNRTKYPIGHGARYYLQGNLAFLDVEGEYHYNKKTGELYYYPKAEETDMNSQRVVAPMVQEIFRFEGSDKPEIADWGKEPDFKKQVSNITIDGLVLKNTEYTSYFTSGWNYSDAGGGIWKHAPEALGSTNPSYDEQTDRTEHKVGAITMINSNHLTVQNTQIHNTGLWAVAMFKDNTFHTIRDCDFGFNGYGSVTIDGGYPGVGKYCNNITVENVRMHDIGQNIGHAAGLTIMSCGQSNFRNLEIYNSPRRAMMVSGGPKRDHTDNNLDQITDMYTIGNHYEYIHVYNCEQDSGEDSAVYVCMLFRTQWLRDKYGNAGIKKDENGREYFDVSWDGVDRNNYFNQILIDSTLSNPSMRDKNTVHGMDLCMGVNGMYLSNIQGTNNQSCTLRIEEGGGDKYFMDNLNNNYRSDDLMNQFDSSKMDYDNIGLTGDFPFPAEYILYPQEEQPEDIYFSDDFESGVLDTTKWISEKGDAKITGAYIAEGPHKGNYSLGLDCNRNKANGGVVLSRVFDDPLNKIVQVKYFDKRLDYAPSDANEESVPVDITPDSWVRADNGKNIVAIGANGDISKDYYLYRSGEEIVKTNVQRKAGWHTFLFDYTSKTDVKMYIDGQQIAVLPASSFSYLGMGDWTGNGGASFYDQIYIYGGEYAPPVKPLPELHTIPGRLEAESFQNMWGIDSEDCDDEEGGRNLTGIETGDWVEYNGKVGQAGTYETAFRVLIPEGQTAEFDLLSDGQLVKTVSLSSTDGKWQTRNEYISLASGLHKLKIVAKTSGWKINWMNYIFAGQDIPCKMEAENYTAQSGVQQDPVAGGGMGVGYIDDGDWMEYKVFVKDPGTYGLNYRAAVNNKTGGEVEFLANGVSLAKTPLADTGGWQNWQTFSDKAEIKEAGIYTIRLHVVKGAWNLDWFELSSETTDPEPEPPLPPSLPVEIFGEDFEGENPTILVPSKDGILQEVVLDPTAPVLSGGWENLKEAKSVSDNNASGRRGHAGVSGSDSALGDSASGISGSRLSGSVSENESWPGVSGNEGKNDVIETGNKVLHVKSPDGTLYLEIPEGDTAENWRNYTFECKILIDKWQGNAEGLKPWDNMAPAWYVNAAEKYARYSLKYNRQDETFLLYRRYNGDKDLESKAAPASFSGTWHDYKIVMKNGLITAFVDGERTFEYTDTSLNGGTIGFDGINVEYYVDDIRVTREKTANPSASVDSCEFTEAFPVKLTVPAEGARIAYTLDGSDPAADGNGIPYTLDSEINITETTTLKFAAVEEGKAYSDVIVCEYICVGKAVEGISFSETEKTVKPGTGFTLTATVVPEDAADKTVIWSSSDSSVASVEEGNVWAHKAGEAMITATTRDGGFRASCAVRVETLSLKEGADAAAEELKSILENSGMTQVQKKDAAETVLKGLAEEEWNTFTLDSTDIREKLREIEKSLEELLGGYLTIEVEEGLNLGLGNVLLNVPAGEQAALKAVKTTVPQILPDEGKELKNAFAADIKLLGTDGAISLRIPVIMSFNLPETMTRAGSIAVYHVTDQGKCEKLDYQLNGNTLEVLTGGFSTFVVANLADGQTGGGENPGGDHDGTEDGGSGNAGNNGDNGNNKDEMITQPDDTDQAVNNGNRKSPATYDNSQKTPIVTEENGIVKEEVAAAAAVTEVQEKNNIFLFSLAAGIIVMLVAGVRYNRKQKEK